MTRLLTCSTVAMCAVWFLSACSGGGADSAADNMAPVAADGFCTLQIGTGAGSWTAEFDSSCVGCTVADADNAIDNDGETFATVSMGSTGTGAYSLRAVAQDGVVFPAGSTPGIRLIHFRNGPTTVSLDFITRLAGVVQEQSEPFVAGSVGTMSGYGGTAQLATQQAFDEIELSVSFGAGTMETIEVYEFCGDLAEPAR